MNNMHWFYAENIRNKVYGFSEQESKHAVRVLRLQKGDQVMLSNGKGTVFSGMIADDHPKHCSLAITSKKSYSKRNFKIHIAVAPTKNISRFEWFLEKATEVGIEAITPLFCEHSERLQIRNDRLEKIIITALKQSQQAWLPVLNEATGFDSLVSKTFSGQKFIAYVDQNHDQLLQDVYQTGNDALILIGPEGDFSKAEIDAAISNGFAPISLGKNRLRTETAAFVACHTINLINQSNIRK